ncbi:hypothetical protein CGMCC3_g11209 [Colletotrichum fructicola]|uniref:Uncharacterized protein n=2 Tax=Colletotrichum fructicola (strain Nara gc5) TaxID=1213859 RepID=L2FMN3_COLFN|nr:uncharacterized protein CGMCC3_g11209 [Colletotrichum fructicola]KAE9572779.1 hypothetical protein CGMCC3_g11209 [Colletotrichum fructicola]KAF4905972.1 hypothetical protein CGCFRS4_v000474 [Colletotrichum fructicola]
MSDYFVPQDREEFWGDNLEMLTAAEQYEKRIHELVNNGLVKDTFRHPWQREIYRYNFPQVSVRVFSGHVGPSNFQGNQKEIFYHYDQGRDNESSEPFRRLILLEDVDPRFAELLGVELDIPPEFWLAHCDGTCHLNTVDGMLNHQGRSTYWRVPVPQTRFLPHDDNRKTGEYYIETGAFDRFSQQVNEHDSIVRFEGFISFWGKKHDNGWTAVVLVDPQLTCLRLHEVGTRIFAKDSSYVRKDIFKFVNVSGRGSDVPNPHLCVPFDVLNAAYGEFTDVINMENNFRPNDGRCTQNNCLNPEDSESKQDLVAEKNLKDPFVATILIRNLVYSMWNEETLRFTSQINDALLDDRNEWEWADFNVEQYVDRLESNIGVDGKGYQDAMLKLQNTWSRKQSIRHMMDAFLAVNTDLDGFDYDLAAVVNGKIDNRVQAHMVLEQRRWKAINEKLQELELRIGLFMENYATRAQLLNAYAAHRQARSAGQLTKLATVAVPFSVVSAIFSMGGDFAAGERLFGIFWAITLPVTGLLLIWIIFSVKLSESQAWIQEKMMEKWRSRRENGFHTFSRRKEGKAV